MHGTGKQAPISYKPHRQAEEVLQRLQTADRRDWRRRRFQKRTKEFSEGSRAAARRAGAAVGVTLPGRG